MRARAGCCSAQLLLGGVKGGFGPPPGAGAQVGGDDTADEKEGEQRRVWPF